jgi:Ca-activated chloride channel homolog
MKLSQLSWRLALIPTVICACSQAIQPPPPVVAVAPKPVASVAASVDPQDLPEPPYTGPAHVFTPHSHAPRVHAAPPEPPKLWKLPLMKNQISKCYGAPHPEPRRRIQGSGRFGTAGGMGFGSGSGSFGGAVGRKKVGARPPSVTSKSGGVGGGNHSRAEAKPAKRKEMGPRPAPPPKVSKRSPPGGNAGGMVPPSLSPPPPPPPPPTATTTLTPKQQIAKSEKMVPRNLDSGNDEVTEIPKKKKKFDDWGSAIYLSNDDTMSLSSAQRVMYAMDHFLPIPVEHIRPHELLNYFSFQTTEVAKGMDFSVQAAIAPKNEEGKHTLALTVQGRKLNLEQRRNAVVTVVVDRSGSMSAEGRMNYLKRGLTKMVSGLKRGDIVNLVLFDHQLCVPIENFVIGRDSNKTLIQAIDKLKPQGGTNLHLGLTKGYEIADRSYQDRYTNRVVLITDALTNRGVRDTRLIATVGKFYDKRRIRLSGVGVGRTFNDELLDKLTEKGKGAYVFLGSEKEVDSIFGSRLNSLLETTALDVHFRLHLPPSMRMDVFYGEESSTEKADVQAVHYFANTSQMFLSDLQARGNKFRPEDSIMLSVEYQDPDTEQKLVEQVAFRLGDIQKASDNLRKGRMAMTWADGLTELSTLSTVHVADRDTLASKANTVCKTQSAKLSKAQEELGDDPDAKEMLRLWNKYCSRFQDR